MSPEQARGETAGTASDVYSLGLVLFELATGQRPFGRQSLDETGARRAKPPKRRSVRPRLARGALDGLIDRMLEPDAAKRISMQEAAEQLELRERRSLAHRGWKVAALSACLLFAAVLLPWLLRYPHSQIDFSRMTVRPLASQLGLEDSPSISPDGLWITCLYRAHAVDRPQLQVHSTKGGPPVVIETGGLLVQGPAAWSPDSNELAFAARENHASTPFIECAGTGVLPNELPPASRGPTEAASWTGRRTEQLWQLPIGGRANSELYLFDLASGRRRDLIAPDNASA